MKITALKSSYCGSFNLELKLERKFHFHFGIIYFSIPKINFYSAPETRRIVAFDISARLGFSGPEIHSVTCYVCFGHFRNSTNLIFG